MRSAGPGAGGGRSRWLHPLRSVRVRITLAAVVVTGVAVGTAGALLVRSVEDRETRRVQAAIDADLDEVAAQLEDGVSPCEAMQSMDAQSSSGFLQISDPDGMVLTFAAGPEGTLYSASVQHRVNTAAGGETGRRAATDVATAPTLPCGERTPAGEPAGDRELVLAGEPPAGSTPPPSSAGDGEELRSAMLGRTAVMSSYETITRTVDTADGRMTVAAAVPVDQLAGTVDRLRQGLLVGLPALIAVVAALAWVLVGRALRPVEAIRAEVDAITGSTMHRRVPVPPTGDEIGRLARTMNAMLGRLDVSATRQRQFVADASHELRSPVAALRTSLEVARRNPARADWPAVADAALAEEARLESLLDDLLLLAAHDENGAGTAGTVPVDVAALAESDAQRPRRVPVTASVRVPGGDRADHEGVVVEGDAAELARAVGNLIDNAGRYATSAVEVAVARTGDTVRITVDDDGPGIPPADRQRVFERFARLDDSRARPDGGTGLGLAVVRAIVTRHHGRVWAEQAPAGGARLVVEIPADGVGPHHGR